LAIWFTLLTYLFWVVLLEIEFLEERIGSIPEANLGFLKEALD